MFKLKIGAYWLSLASLLLLFCTTIAYPEQILTVHSSSFASGSSIPQPYTCKGGNRSPALAWENAPAHSKSFAIIVEDPDAPAGIFVHWVVYSLPAARTSLPEAIPQSPEIPGGGMQGFNDFGHYGYDGPCPPPGQTHHYHFRVYALDEVPQVSEKPTASEVKAAMKDHVLASGELIGTFSR
jgi:Raf kinase inhibitor-like YbhB/YbcL family protein